MSVLTRSRRVSRAAKGILMRLGKDGGCTDPFRIFVKAFSGDVSMSFAEVKGKSKNHVFATILALNRVKTYCFRCSAVVFELAMREMAAL